MIAPLYNNALDGDVQMRQQWLSITNRYVRLARTHMRTYIYMHNVGHNGWENRTKSEIEEVKEE